jgi:hypothetical protein
MSGGQNPGYQAEIGVLDESGIVQFEAMTRWQDQVFQVL